jgi:signal transduction histidine kinase
MISIRRDLQVRLVFALVLLLGGAGAGVFLALRRIIVDQFDSGLESRAKLLSALVKYEPGEGLETELDEVWIPEYQGSSMPEYFELRLPDGSAHTRSASLGASTLLGSPGRVSVTRFWDLRLPDGRRGRAVAFPFVPQVEEKGKARARAQSDPGRETLILLAARERAPLDAALRGVTVALLALGALLLLVIPAIVARSVRRGLRPLDGLGTRAASIDANRLEVRFATDGMPAELQPIVGRLDELLARLSSSFERERRFSADVAHELRTPLAELRTIATVFPTTTDPVAEATAALRDVGAAAAQMENIVTTLLALARCDAGRQPVNSVAVDLGRALEEAWVPLEGAARDKGLVVDLGLTTAGTIVRTDRTLLASILGNLLANAVEYAPAGGRVSAAMATASDRVTLRIENTHRELAAEDLGRLFDPFWRKDQARTDGSHAGLGLSLVAAFARLLRLEVTATLPRPDLVSFTLLFASNERPEAGGGPPIHADPRG